MPKSRVTSDQQAPLIWQQFQTVVDPQLLLAPRLHWEQIDRRLLFYINKNVAGCPWCNQLAFVVATSVGYAHIGMKTVRDRLQALHLRWQTVFAAYGLTDFREWNPAEHLPRYMNDPELEDSFSTRQTFFRLYMASVHNVHAYLRSLPAQE